MYELFLKTFLIINQLIRVSIVRHHHVDKHSLLASTKSEYSLLTVPMSLRVLNQKLLTLSTLHCIIFVFFEFIQYLRNRFCIIFNIFLINVFKIYIWCIYRNFILKQIYLHYFIDLYYIKYTIFVAHILTFTYLQLKYISMLKKYIFKLLNGRFKCIYVNAAYIKIDL